MGVARTNDPAETTAAGAAAELLRRRLRDLHRALAAFLKHPSGDKSIHALRVAARRASVTLALAQPCLRDAWHRRARRCLRTIRRASGPVRDAEVHLTLLEAAAAALKGKPAQAALVTADLIRTDLAKAREAFAAAALECRGTPRRLARDLEAQTRRTALDLPVAEWAFGSIRAARDALEAADLAPLSDPEALHTLRLAVKRLRYANDELARWLPAGGTPEERATLVEAQQRLGEAGDVATLCERLTSMTVERPDLAILRDRFADIRRRRTDGAIAWWRANHSRVNPSVPAPEAPTMPQTQSHPTSNGTHLTPNPQAGLWHAGRRLAVIDIGSNGIRLLAVELIDAASWRSIAEERAMTRLAHGLAATRRLCPEAMASAVEAITRFKSIATSLGVHSVRAFATAAVREAENRDDFLSLVRDRAGLCVELVSARDEGSLTFRSAARVFDLSHGESTTVDIGGGSLEVVSSTDGVITANTSMPLGAVRLTEAFGGADLASGENYKAMRRAIRRSIESHVPARRIPPSMVVGCGGTFTTLLTLAAASRGVLIERNSPALLTLGPVTRTQLKGVIKSLRGVPLAQRLRVPGLPSDRADIIVAGLTVIDQLMRRLGATQLHVHPGGFREGLLLRMIEQAAPAAALPESARADGVRALAQRCQADLAHASHVTGLALSLYDQFVAAGAAIPRLGSDPDERALLHAAAMLHDVGIRVSYEKHHKHSMTIIRHALLPGFSEAQAELIAQVARYHRRAVPRASHKSFARLAPAQQALVRRLAGLLRVADGLDRQHAQRVAGVRVEPAPGRPGIIVQASGDAEPDLAAARKKSDLLRKLLGAEVRIVAPPAAPAPAPAPSPTTAG